jgi:alkylation response protein AidB-like acyl-CoA dehydrogenase
VQVRDVARAFNEEHIRPFAAERDRAHVFDRDVLRRMGELGFFGMLVPEAYDGLGLDRLTHVLALEEIAAGDASVAISMSVHNSLPTQMLLCQGAPEQQERWLRPMARGELLGPSRCRRPMRAPPPPPAGRGDANGSSSPA